MTLLKRSAMSAVGRSRFAWRKRVAVWRLRWWCLRRGISWTPEPRGWERGRQR